MPVEPQAALEQAVVNLMQASTGSGGLAYPSASCRRMLDGQPPPLCGLWFVSVWSDNRIDAGPVMQTALDRYFSVSVTITVRLVQPFDRWLAHRDELAVKANDIVALVHEDRLNHVICNAANTLAGYRASGSPNGTSVVGFCESLVFDGADAIQDVGPDWFHASLEQGERNCGLAQRLRFGRCRHIQALGNME